MAETFRLRIYDKLPDLIKYFEVNGFEYPYTPEIEYERFASGSPQQNWALFQVCVFFI